MFRYTYETTACASYVIREIKVALQKAHINGELTKAETSSGRRLERVLQVMPYSKAIPAFHHPINIASGDDDPLIVIDQRPNMGLERSGTPKITQRTQYDFMTLRGALEYLWNTGHASSMQLLGQIPFKTYSRMMSENIRRRLGLDPESQMLLTALSGYYYQCQFINDTTLDDDRKLKMATRIKNYSSVQVTDTLRLIDPLPVLTDLSSFTAAIKSSIQSVRVETLTPALLISFNMGMWYGGNAREVMAVALEYPPAFIAMVFTALNDRSMHSAMFSKLVDTVAKNATAAEFNNGVKALLEGMSDV